MSGETHVRVEGEERGQRRLHSFHASSASYRVRIALALKGLAYDYVAVALRWDGGDQDGAKYRALNPQGRLPLLEDGNITVTQSLAIIDYLDRAYPEPPLYPSDAQRRGQVMSLALYIACEIQPLNNLSAERWLAREHGQDQDALRRWRTHWMENGFDAIEQTLKGGLYGGAYCCGESPGAADCLLVPQVYKALQPNAALDMTRWPTVWAAYQHCTKHPAFQAADPSKTPDAPST